MLKKSALFVAALTAATILQAAPESKLPATDRSAELRASQAMDKSWQRYQQSRDAAAIAQAIDLAIRPLAMLETDKGPLTDAEMEADPTEISLAEATKLHQDNLKIMAARWHLAGWVNKDKAVRAMVEERKARSQGNAAIVLQDVLTNPPKTASFIDEQYAKMRAGGANIYQTEEESLAAAKRANASGDLHRKAMENYKAAAAKTAR